MEGKCVFLLNWWRILYDLKGKMTPHRDVANQQNVKSFYKQTVTHPVSQTNYFNHHEERVMKAVNWRLCLCKTVSLITFFIIVVIVVVVAFKLQMQVNTY